MKPVDFAVGIASAPSPYRSQRFLVVIDGSASGWRALNYALSLCQLHAAWITALAVVGRLPVYAATVGEVDEARRERRAYLQDMLDQAAEIAMAQGVALETALMPGRGPSTIISYAQSRSYHLIVMGESARVLGFGPLGSLADRVARGAHCDVVVVT